MTDIRKPVKYGKGNFQFRKFSDVLDQRGRAQKGVLMSAAKHSKADSLLRKFSWEDKDE